MSVTISRILHAGYLFECEGTRIICDPLFENPFGVNCFAFPNVQFNKEQIKNLKLDAIFISHYHDDHCSFASLDLLDRNIPIYLFCLHEEMFSLLRQLGFKKVHPLKINEVVTVGSCKVIARRALDADVDSILQIRAKNLNILNVVDSWIDDSTLSLLTAEGPWDLILWPFQTMREIEVLSPKQMQPATHTLPPEWTEQLKILRPKYLVPSSCQFRFEEWSWYNKVFFPISYQQFAKEISALLPETKTLRMNPSVSIELEKSSAYASDELSAKASRPLTWVRPIGEQNVDYIYDENVKPQTTAEIATHFDELKPDQQTRALEYCKEGLLKKWKTLDLSDESYFQKPRRWKLSLFDQKGQKTEFFYQIHGSEIKPMSSVEADWQTEIPLAKIFGALENGESLTSIYLRVAAKEFVDVLEDPLLCCLYDGAFASYQKVQLRKNV